MHSRVLTGVALAAVIAVVGIGLASADGGTVHHACVKTSGAMFLVDGPDACKGTETHISWNQVGPAGPQGPQGEQGPAGPQGEQGVLGFYQVRSEPHWADAYWYFEARAVCNEGDAVSGGGFYSLGGGQVNWTNSKRDGNGWFVSGVNVDISQYVGAVVECADMTP